MTLPELGKLAEDAGKILGFIAAVGGALIGISTMVKYGKKWGTSAKKYVVAWFSMPTVLTTQDARLKNIENIVQKELTTNGGSSIRDAITRIDKRQILDETRNRAMLEHLGVPFWEADHEGKVLYISREFCLLVHRVVDDLLGNAWISTVHPDHRDAVLREWNACVEQGRVFTMEFSYITPEGKEIPVKAETVLLKDKLGNTIGHIGKVWKKFH